MIAFLIDLALMFGYMLLAFISAAIGWAIICGGALR